MPDSITRIGCWAHLRRYFEKARQLGDPAAEKPMNWIGKLFAVDQLGLPKGPLMEGVRYGRNQWSTLERFLSDGRIREISNNGYERALRAVVVGRKYWLFFGSGEGTETMTPASRVGELTPLGRR